MRSLPNGYALSIHSLDLPNRAAQVGLWREGHTSFPLRRMASTATRCHQPSILKTASFRNTRCLQTFGMRFCLRGRTVRTCKKIKFPRFEATGQCTHLASLQESRTWDAGYKGSRISLPQYGGPLHSRVPDEFLVNLIRPISDWMLRTDKILLPNRRDVLDVLWTRILALIKRHNASTETAVIRINQQPDWATDALNSPVGYLAQVLMGDPAINGLKHDGCFPDWWKARVDELLSLSGNHRRHALAIFCHNLVWLFAIDPNWVTQAFLPAIEREDADSDAFWAGFFWGAKVPQEELYSRMKPALLRLAHKGSDTRRKHAEILAGIILVGWGRKMEGEDVRIISDNEMTAVLVDADDDFRVQLLWHLENWSKLAESDWREDAAKLLKQVWPKQIAAKTPRVSAKLAELAFAQGDCFPLFVDYVLPLVVPVDQDYIRLPIERTDSDKLVETYPERTLALLSAVLTDNARQWPYGISELLDRIAKADPQLLTDGRLIKLNRIRASS
jgi:hypothetical protein